MRITIKSANLKNLRQYKDKNYGEQEAALDAGGDFALPFKLNRQEGEAYAPGQYTLAPESFTTDEHGNLKIKRPSLIPLGK